jgi:hypothetical protein
MRETEKENQNQKMPSCVIFYLYIEEKKDREEVNLVFLFFILE